MKNCAAYYALSPRIEKAFKLFAEVDWTKAEAGKMELDGKEIFANVQERGLKTKEEAKEKHLGPVRSYRTVAAAGLVDDLGVVVHHSL